MKLLKSKKPAIEAPGGGIAADDLGLLMFYNISSSFTAISWKQIKVGRKSSLQTTSERMLQHR